MGETFRFNRDAAAALLKDARRDFDNGAKELWRMGDEAQRPTIEATVEVIGRLSDLLDNPYAWPTRESQHGDGKYPVEAEVEFTPAVLAWIERNVEHQEAYVADLERGEWSGAEPGYLPEQVYLLYVLESLVGQRDAEAVAAS